MENHNFNTPKDVFISTSVKQPQIVAKSFSWWQISDKNGEGLYWSGRSVVAALGHCYLLLLTVNTLVQAEFLENFFIGANPRFQYEETSISGPRLWIGMKWFQRINDFKNLIVFICAAIKIIFWGGINMEILVWSCFLLKEL